MSETGTKVDEKKSGTEGLAEAFEDFVDVVIDKSKLSEEVNDLKKQNNDQASEIKTLYDYLGELTKQREEGVVQIARLQKDQKNEFDSIKKHIQDDKIRLIEIIGIFAAIITFVAVEIQILKAATDGLVLAGLSLIMYAGLAGFVSTIVQISEYWVRGRNKKFSLIKGSILKFAVGSGVLGVMLVSGSFYLNKDTYVQKIETDSFHCDTAEVTKVKIATKYSSTTTSTPQK